MGGASLGRFSGCKGCTVLLFFFGERFRRAGSSTLRLRLRLRFLFWGVCVAKVVRQSGTPCIAPTLDLKLSVSLRHLSQIVDMVNEKAVFSGAL